MKLLSVIFHLSFMLPAVCAEFVITSRTGGTLQNYPLQPPAGSFVEVIQVGGSGQVWPLKVTFSDGRETEDFEARNKTAGFKMVGVSSIVPITTADHTILWKITPASEFVKDGATYHTLLANDGPLFPTPTFSVPAGSLVRILQAQGAEAFLALTSTVPGLSSSQTGVPVPSPQYPFLTSIQNLSASVLLEITPASSPTNARVTIQQSENLQNWETLHSFQLAPNRPKQFFRASITTPAE